MRLAVAAMPYWPVIAADGQARCVDHLLCAVAACTANQHAPPSKSLTPTCSQIVAPPHWQVFIDLDVAKAQATNPEDCTRILADIERDVGVLAMGHDLKNALVDSIVAEVPPRNQKWDKATGYKLYKAARLCQLYGRLEQAEPYYR